MDLPTLIEKGGVIVEILLFLNFIGFTVMIWKFLALNSAKRNLLATSQTFLENEQRNPNALVSKIESYVSGLETGLNTVKIIAQIAPLLGLLGTVIGVLSAFEAISQSGLGDPSVFSGGISVALITTVVGLIVSIPHYIAYNYLIGHLDRLEILLKEAVFNQVESEHHES